ncbi:MAG: tetratricopeptide repeat protein [Methylococcaceae bacterium]|nr:tetratricopeptide repeat protein [Methylococcaceae bacterium]
MKIFNKYSLIVLMAVKLSFSVAFAATYSGSEEGTGISFGADILNGVEAGSTQYIKYQEVIGYMKNRQLTKAQRALTQLSQEFSDDARLNNLQALLDIFQGDKISAHSSYKKTIENDSNNLTANLGLAGLEFEMGQLDKAKGFSNKVLALDSKNLNANYILAKISVKSGDYVNAEKLLLNAYQRNIGNIDVELKALSYLGQFYAMQKQPKKVLKLANEIVAKYPVDYRALSFLAGGQIVNEQNKEAERTLRKIIAIKKDDVNHRLMLVRVLAKTSEGSKEVLSVLDEILSISSENQPAIVAKANYLIKLKRFQDAMIFSKTIEDKFPGSSLGKQLQGDVFSAERKADQALDAYQQSYAIEPVGKVLNHIVSIMVYQGKQKNAIALLESELSKQVNSTQIHLKLARIYTSFNKVELVAKHYNAVLKMQPDNLVALNNLAWFYKEQNKFGKAEELSKKAYNLAPKSVSLADTYGYILLKKGKVNEGLEVFLKISESAVSSVDVSMHLAEAYILTGNKKQAIKVMNKFIDNAKNVKDKQLATNYLDGIK